MAFVHQTKPATVRPHPTLPWGPASTCLYTSEKKGAAQAMQQGPVVGCNLISKLPLGNLTVLWSVCKIEDTDDIFSPFSK